MEIVGEKSGDIEGELKDLAVGHCQGCAGGGGNGPAVGLFKRVDFGCDDTYQLARSGFPRFVSKQRTFQ